MPPNAARPRPHPPSNPLRRRRRAKARRKPRPWPPSPWKRASAPASARSPTAPARRLGRSASARRSSDEAHRGRELLSEGYSVRDVTKLLGLSRSIVSGFIRAGIVAPARGRRGEYRFSFPDLVVLRTAQALTAAKLPPSRIVRSLRRLRAKLPESV